MVQPRYSDANLPEEANIKGDAIDAMAYTTTCCTVVALDKNGAPLRPALMWMDVRADKEAEAVRTGSAPHSEHWSGTGFLEW